MKIAMLAEFYLPSRGGVENVADLLSRSFCEKGHEVTILTGTPQNEPDQEPFKVIRNPSLTQVWKVISACDSVISHGLCRKYLWPIIFIKRPAIVVRHMVSDFTGLNVIINGIFEKRLRVLFVSRFIASLESDKPPRCIPTPYNENVFRDEGVSSDRSGIAYVAGHFSPAKGFQVLLSALEILRERGMRPLLKAIGERERIRAEEEVRRRNLTDQVQFLGGMCQKEVAEEIRRCQLLVVPSICMESFGMAAVEGIASGCLVIASNIGGLPEAVGSCGLMFEPGDAQGLASQIERGFSDLSLHLELQSRRDEHLLRYRPSKVADVYLDHIRELCAKS